MREFFAAAGGLVGVVALSTLAGLLAGVLVYAIAVIGRKGR